MRNIDFFKHNLTLSDKKSCMKVLDSLFLTTGDVTKTFEKKFAEYSGLKYSAGLHSCTEALFLALKYFGIKPGDEVITTPLSFIATANAIEYTGAKPVFADVESTTGNINPEEIEKAITKRTRAIIPVHLYGQMCDMKEIRKIADKNKLKIIEDCAHCIEGKRDGIRPGQLGDIACFSFYATKNITCGEGGAIACNDKKIHDWFMKGRLHGMSKNAAERYLGKYEHYDMLFLGYKCNMNDIQASLLIGQLDRIGFLLSKKEKVANIYDRGFAQNAKIKIPQVEKESVHARHLYTIWVNPNKRDEYMHKMQEKGVGVAVNFRTIHLMKYYRDKYGYKPGDFPEAEKIGNSTITLPFYPKLTRSEIGYVIKTVNSITAH